MIQYIEKTLIDHWDLPAYSDYQGDSYSYADVASHIQAVNIRREEFEKTAKRSIKRHLYK